MPFCLSSVNFFFSRFNLIWSLFILSWQRPHKNPVAIVGFGFSGIVFFSFLFFYLFWFLMLFRARFIEMFDVFYILGISPPAPTYVRWTKRKSFLMCTTWSVDLCSCTVPLHATTAVYTPPEFLSVALIQIKTRKQHNNNNNSCSASRNHGYEITPMANEGLLMLPPLLSRFQFLFFSFFFFCKTSLRYKYWS